MVFLKAPPDMRLLIAEDEPDFRSVLAKSLRAQGYAVDEAGDGIDALHKAESSDYDTIILDLMLPNLDGIEVLRRLRKTRKTPVLMLTAQTQIGQRVKGLDAGADDYVPKPVDLNELSARVRALIRRAAGDASAVVQVADLVIDTASRRVTRGGEPVVFTAREYAVLEFLARHRGKIVTRTDLYEHLHDETDTPLSNLVDVHIFNLRKKLGSARIVTHRGLGYSLES